MVKRKTEAQLCMEALLTEIADKVLMFWWYPELQFTDKRKWRFDYALPAKHIGIEIEGGIWVQGRHTRGKGYQADLDKYNTAASLGWRVFRFSTQDVLDGTAATFLRSALSE